MSELFTCSTTLKINALAKAPAVIFSSFNFIAQCACVTPGISI